ncbi:VRR-NUC domain-containing protein [Anaerovorax sp. IOR16]|uniref:VRR-NUC domain-containing protein n=1 Tax=Anaerovorax sp. IOR16 TaxID=2773458 RepID=UPI0019CF72CF|nr:VRR-NUC domain-containing protein [Anaerovorax sp. IOR16]
MPRKSKYPKTQTEGIEQSTLMEWAELSKGKFPELRLLFHIPNGGSRHLIEAANLKKQGVKAGVPDLCLPVPKGEYHGLYIEMKAKTNTPTKEQKEWIKELTQQGYFATVCWGWMQAAKVITDYLTSRL